MFLFNCGAIASTKLCELVHVSSVFYLCFQHGGKTFWLSKNCQLHKVKYRWTQRSRYCDLVELLRCHLSQMWPNRAGVKRGGRSMCACVRFPDWGRFQDFRNQMFWHLSGPPKPPSVYSTASLISWESDSYKADLRNLVFLAAVRPNPCH